MYLTLNSLSRNSFLDHKSQRFQLSKTFQAKHQGLMYQTKANKYLNDMCTHMLFLNVTLCTLEPGRHL